MGETPLRILEIWPHRALGKRGRGVFLLVLGGFIALLMAMIFFAPGAELIGPGGLALILATLPFFGLAFAGVWWAVRRNDLERARQCDRLLFFRDRLVVEQVNPQGQTSRWEAPLWLVQARLRPGPQGEAVILSSSGRELVVGAFLALDERAKLAAEIDGALHKARGSG